jgi:DNA polymerase III subunit gamma/tau
MSFKDIVGQEVAKRILQTQIKTNRISTTYLFYGPEGVGKTLTAKTFAKAINCREASWDACDKCSACIGIENLRNPDFTILSPEKNKSIGIDQIRSLKANLSYYTTWLDFRVIIIKMADKLTEEASNALLKILEEAPKETIFILTTSKKEALLETVKSRAQQIEFRRLKEEELQKLLPPGCSKVILKLARGSVTRALRLMEMELNEIRACVFQFIHTSPVLRIQMIHNIIDIEEFLRLAEEMYMDLLAKNLGAIELIKNSDLEFKKRLSTLEILKAITICERGFSALSRNVNKELIFYWLSKELP